MLWLYMLDEPAFKLLDTIWVGQNVTRREPLVHFSYGDSIASKENETRNLTTRIAGEYFRL